MIAYAISAGGAKRHSISTILISDARALYTFLHFIILLSFPRLRGFDISIRAQSPPIHIAYYFR